MGVGGGGRDGEGNRPSWLGVEGGGDWSQIQSPEANLGTRGRGKPGPSNLGGSPHPSSPDQE